MATPELDKRIFYVIGFFDAIDGADKRRTESSE
jgi:hypothetical protein